MRIALVGTRGVPARYGGFETAVEEVGARLAAAGHDIVVYCRGEDRSEAYRGMTRVRLPALRRRTAETLSHTALSVAHLVRRRPDVAVLFNAANAPFLPVLRAARIPTAVHVDGLEWKRGKWGPLGRRYYLANERIAVALADALIADAVGIQRYYEERYGAESTFIPYGAPETPPPDAAHLDGLGLQEGKYHLVVARMEPENHVDLVLEGYLGSSCQLPLVVVGDVPYRSGYSDRIRELAETDNRIQLLGSVWDQSVLDSLYAGALLYLHGHSVGGTNPSLLRAMGAGAAVVGFDVDFNREVLGDAGRYFATSAEVSQLLEAAERDPASTRTSGEAGRSRALERYRWDDVAEGYATLCARLAAR